MRNRIAEYRKWDYYNGINRLYQLNSFQFAWLTNFTAQTQFLKILNLADSFGLNPDDYRYPFLKTYIPGQRLKNTDDSMDVDIQLTASAIHFFTELKYGNKTPVFSYTGLKYDPFANSDIASQLLVHLKTEPLEKFISESSTYDTTEYKAIQ